MTFAEGRADLDSTCSGTLVLLLIETAYLAACLPETRWYKEGKEDVKVDGKKVEPTGPPRTLAERKTRLKELQWIHLWFLYFFSGAF